MFSFNFFAKGAHNSLAFFLIKNFLRGAKKREEDFFKKK